MKNAVSQQPTISAASRKERQRRLQFVLKLFLFLIVVVAYYLYPRWVKNDFGLPQSMVNALFFYVSSNIVISFVRLSLVAIYLRRRKRLSDFRNNFIIGINQIASILSFLTLVISVFLVFQINLREFFTSISIIAAAIAILFKDYITNMINGLILMFSEDLSVDDYVQIDQNRGKITDITLLNVHLLTEDDDLVYIPNNHMLTANIINYTRQNQRKVSLEFSLQPEQITEGLNVMEHYLAGTLKPYEADIRPDSMHMRVISINPHSVTIRFHLMLNRQNSRIEREIRRTLNWHIISYINQRHAEKALKS
jgi:small-conductance mechanosensitive channel